MKEILEYPKTRNNSALSTEEISVFRKLIQKKISDAEEELDFLLNSINEMRENNSSDSSSSQHHVADVGSSEATIEMNFRLVERTRRFIRQLKRALIRIDEGKYGICKVTGKPIARERLLATPHTQHSIEAKLLKSHSLN